MKIALARIHAHRKGKAHSTRPVTKRVPSWCNYNAEEVESLVIKLAKEGHPSGKIGAILRSQYGIPLAKPITGKKITKILKDAGLTPAIPEDLSTLTRRANSLARHLQKNPRDHKNNHSLQLLESRIHRLATYYKDRKLIPADWKFEAVVGSFV